MDKIFKIDGSFESVSYEYRNNANPITRCGYIVSDRDSRDLFQVRGLTILNILDEALGQFYHIDPTSLYTTSNPRWHAEVVYFKAKSRIRPYAEELDAYHLECLEYWIENLQAF